MVDNFLKIGRFGTVLFTGVVMHIAAAKSYLNLMCTLPSVDDDMDWTNDERVNSLVVLMKVLTRVYMNQTLRVIELLKSVDPANLDPHDRTSLLCAWCDLIIRTGETRDVQAYIADVSDRCSQVDKLWVRSFLEVKYPNRPDILRFIPADHIQDPVLRKYRKKWRKCTKYPLKDSSRFVIALRDYDRDAEAQELYDFIGKIRYSPEEYADLEPESEAPVWTPQARTELPPPAHSRIEHIKEMLSAPESRPSAYSMLLDMSLESKMTRWSTNTLMELAIELREYAVARETLSSHGHVLRRRQRNSFERAIDQALDIQRNGPRPAMTSSVLRDGIARAPIDQLAARSMKRR
jgi:hypothetical protein